MKKNIKLFSILIFVILGVFIFYKAPSFSNTEEGDFYMKIKMSFNNQIVIINMYENEATKQLIALLPCDFKFSDFAGEEKITNFPKALNLENAPRGMIAKKGKLFIYAPWDNMGIFYKDHGTTVDKSLIPLGEVESGLEYLSNQKSDFRAKMEILK